MQRRECFDHNLDGLARRLTFLLLHAPRDDDKEFLVAIIEQLTTYIESTVANKHLAT